MDLELVRQTTFYDNTLTTWAWAAGLAVVTALVLRLVLTLATRRFRRLAERSETGADDLICELLTRTRTFLIALVAAWVGASTLVLPPDVDDVVRALLIVGVLIQIGIWGGALIQYLLRRYRDQQLETDPGAATAMGVLRFIALVILWTTLALVALGSLGVEVTPFLASLGIGGIAIALALQNVLSDLFASLSIVLDKPFVIGDFVVVGDLAGSVEHVGLKTTRIRSLGGEQLVFSNSDLLDSRIRNFKRMNERRIVFQLGVEYGTPLEKLRRIPEMVREAVEAQENVRFDRSHFKEYGAFSLDFETVYYMLSPDFNAYMDTQQAINLEIYERFEDEGLVFAFPTQTLHVATTPAPEPAPV